MVKGKSITLIEMKCCPDTRPELQLQRAQEQHADLLSALKQAGYDAELCVLLVGAGGLTYDKHTLQALQALGVKKDAAETCLKKLSVRAIADSEQLYRSMLAARAAAFRPP
jgi:Holliday junction resolvasome RuvABC DNA-binding subunit